MYTKKIEINNIIIWIETCEKKIYEKNNKYILKIVKLRVKDKFAIVGVFKIFYFLNL